jgi:hypothetical protein
MSRRVWLLLMLLLCAVPGVASAQDCGAGLPCGPLPWQLPGLPDLNSPTPFPAVTITTTPAPTATGTITATPSPTSDFSLDEIRDQIGTLQAIANGTQEVAATADPSDFTDENIGGTIPIFFRFTHWMTNFRFGIFTPLAQVGVFVVGSTITFGLAVLFLPLLGPLIGLVRWIFDILHKLGSLLAQIIQIVVNFIRG